MKKIIFKLLTYDSFLDVLGAWRVWILGALLGGAIACTIYFFAPPPYCAQATVLVDQNVEQVILEEETDLRKFNYLQRETDKLVEIVWSDAVLSRVAVQTGVPVAELRSGSLLQLSQPGDGGWHFLADGPSPESASTLAVAWASSFVEEIRAEPAGISSLVEVNFTQSQNSPVKRSISLGIYVFCGAIIGNVLLALVLLFFGTKDAS